MPTPQEKSLFVEQASCLFLRMVQDLSKRKRDKGKTKLLHIIAIVQDRSGDDLIAQFDGIY
jgi:hypothetical protein